MDTCRSTSVNSGRSEMFTFRELSLCRVIILYTSTRTHLQFSTYYNRVIWFSQNAFLSLSGARGLLGVFNDRLMLSHLHAVPCFPIKMAQLPPSPLRVCAADCGRVRAYILYAMERSKGLREEPPSIISSGRKFREAWRMEGEMEVATGSSI